MERIQENLAESHRLIEQSEIVQRTCNETLDGEERCRKKDWGKNCQMIALDMEVWGKWKHKIIRFLYTVWSNSILIKYIDIKMYIDLPKKKTANSNTKR